MRGDRAGPLRTAGCRSHIIAALCCPRTAPAQTHTRPSSPHTSRPLPTSRSATTSFFFALASNSIDRSTSSSPPSRLSQTESEKWQPSPPERHARWSPARERQRPRRQRRGHRPRPERGG